MNRGRQQQVRGRGLGNPAAGPGLSQPVTGPNGKTYWVTKHKDEFGYAKKYQEKYYDPNKDRIRDSGMFLLPDGKQVIFVDRDKEEEWRYARSDQEKASAEKLVRNYHDRYGEDAAPYKHYQKISQKRYNERQRQQSGRNTPQPHARPAPPQQNKVLYQGITPAQAKFEQNLQLLRRHNIDIDEYLFRTYMHNDVVRLILNAAVLTANSYHKNSKFPDAVTLKRFQLKKMIGALQKTVQTGKKLFGDLGIAIHDNDWKFLDAAVKCASEAPENYGENSQDFYALSLVYNILRVDEFHLETVYRRDYSTAALNDIKFFVENTASSLLDVLIKYDHTRQSLEIQKRAAAQADQITHHQSGGNAEMAIETLVQQSQANAATPALPSAPSRTEFYKAVFKKVIAPTDHHQSALEALYKVVGSKQLPLSYFQHCVQLTDEFRHAWAEYTGVHAGPRSQARASLVRPPQLSAAFGRRGAKRQARKPRGAKFGKGGPLKRKGKGKGKGRLRLF